MKGAGCQRNKSAPAQGGVFSLDIPFYRTQHADDIDRYRGILAGLGLPRDIERDADRKIR
jgi:hypothetical protein